MVDPLNPSCPNVKDNLLPRQQTFAVAELAANTFIVFRNQMSLMRATRSIQGTRLSVTFSDDRGQFL
jgi:hypothetical protein